MDDRETSSPPSNISTPEFPKAIKLIFIGLTAIFSIYLINNAIDNWDIGAKSNPDFYISISMYIVGIILLYIDIRHRFSFYGKAGIALLLLFGVAFHEQHSNKC